MDKSKETFDLGKKGRRNFLRPFAFLFYRSFAVLPGVKEARFDPRVILLGAAEVRVQILHLNHAKREPVVVFVIHAASQGHGKAVRGAPVGPQVLSSKERLAEGVPLAVIPVRYPRPEQVIDVMGAYTGRQPAHSANAKVAHAAQPIVQVIGQVQAEAVTPASPGVDLLVFVTCKELRLGCPLGKSRTCRKEHKYPRNQSVTHYPSKSGLPWVTPLASIDLLMPRGAQATREGKHAPCVCCLPSGRNGGPGRRRGC